MGKKVTRSDGRRVDELRPIRIEPGYSRYAEGSVLFSMGETRVLCTASVEAGVPKFLRGSGTGWVTAEYGMLPRATSTRNRDSRGIPSGRTKEIQRLVGRSLRAVVNRAALGDRTIFIDCDVLQADGGTRTAAITGAYVALADALSWARRNKFLLEDALTDALAAVSVGIVAGKVLLDLDYAEDAAAQVDMNVAMTSAGKLVEVQASAEAAAFSREQLDKMLHSADKGIRRLLASQQTALAQRLRRKTK